jgi:hypothetical protein
VPFSLYDSGDVMLPDFHPSSELHPRALILQVGPDGALLEAAMGYDIQLPSGVTFYREMPWTYISDGQRALAQSLSDSCARAMATGEGLTQEATYHVGDPTAGPTPGPTRDTAGVVDSAAPEPGDPGAGG